MCTKPTLDEGTVERADPAPQLLSDVAPSSATPTLLSLIIKDVYPQALSNVPWSPAKFTIAFTQVLCLCLASGYGSVGLWASIRHLPLENIPVTEIDAVLLSSDVLQLLGVMTIIRAGFGQEITLQLKDQATVPTTALNPKPDALPPLRYVATSEAVAVGITSALVALLPVALLTAATTAQSGGSSPPSPLSPLLETSDPGGLLMLALSNTMVGPMTEELVWRGLLLQSLSSWLRSPLQALVLSSVAFAAYHLSLQDAPALTALGLSMGWAMYRSRGNLLAPTLGHAVYNLVALGSMVLADHRGLS